MASKRANLLFGGVHGVPAIYAGNEPVSGGREAGA